LIKLHALVAFTASVVHTHSLKCTTFLSHILKLDSTFHSIVLIELKMFMDARLHSLKHMPHMVQHGHICSF